jgi:hypothetical protein
MKQFRNIDNYGIDFVGPTLRPGIRTKEDWAKEWEKDETR